MTTPDESAGGFRLHPDLEPLLVDADTLKLHPANPRKGDPALIARSMRANGIYRPVYAQASTGHIIAGNHTYTAMLDAGATRVPAVLLDVDDAEALRILLADNKTAALGWYDADAVASLLAGLSSTDGTGYDTGTDTVTPKAAPGSGSAVDGAARAQSLSDRTDDYFSQGHRMVVLDYDQDQFALLTPKLEELRTRYGVDNNADAIRLYLQDQS